jgi:hypothetical protein
MALLGSLNSEVFAGITGLIGGIDRHYFGYSDLTKKLGGRGCETLGFDLFLRLGGLGKGLNRNCG